MLHNWLLGKDKKESSSGPSSGYLEIVIRPTGFSCSFIAEEGIAAWLGNGVDDHCQSTLSRGQSDWQPYFLLGYQWISDWLPISSQVNKALLICAGKKWKKSIPFVPSHFIIKIFLHYLRRVYICVKIIKKSHFLQINSFLTQYFKVFL